MIKIASLVPYKIVPPVKGGERHIYFFLNKLNAYCNLYCITVTENDGGIDNVKTIPVLGSARNILRYIHPFLFFRIKKILKKNSISHLIIEHPYYGWLGFLLKRYCKVKLIVRSHNIEGNRFREMGKGWWPLLYQYEKWVHRIADKNLFITPEDRLHAIEHFLLNPEKCAVSTYGIDLIRVSENEKRRAKKRICTQLNLNENVKLLLFNGSFAYMPNREGLQMLVKEIYPLLLSKTTISFHIIICGTNIPENYLQRKMEHISFVGFVDDVQMYFNAADIFVNPVIKGGGIKTKLVEALAANDYCVSFENGAIGIPREIVPAHLAVVKNEDNEAFVHAIIDFLGKQTQIVGESFFDYFNWDTIVDKTFKEISRTVNS